MENVENLSSPSKEKIVFEQNAPKLSEVIKSGSLGKRENIVKSVKYDPVTDKPTERIFSEQHGIVDLFNFLNLEIKIAKDVGDAKTAENAQLFRDNITFIGETELKIATEGIARHLIESAQKGKNVIVFPANNRSERYISLRVMEEVDYLTEQNPDLRDRFKISQKPGEIAKKAKELMGNCLVAVPDDFVVSGTRITGFTSRMINSLIEAGYSPEKAMGMVEANVIATPRREKGTKLTFWNKENGKDMSINVFSFYSVPEYKNSNKKWVVYPGVSMTGSHSSTDYGFEVELEKAQEYMENKGVKKDIPLLANIKRPYELVDSSSTDYKDQELQKRWEKIQEKYGLKTSTP